MSTLKENFEAIFDLARVELTGVSDKLLVAQTYQIAHEFFKTSSAWHEFLTVKTVPSVREYIITPDPPGQVIRLLNVFDQNFLPQPAMMPVPDKIIIRDAPNTVFTLNIVVIKNVTLPKGGQLPQFPDYILDLWGPVFLDGLLGYMMNQPAKSWSNGTSATYHLRRFRDGINQARVAAVRRLTQGTNAWAYPQQFRTRNQQGGVSVGNAPVF